MAFLIWTSFQPVVDGTILSYPEWLGVLQWFVGSCLVAAAVIAIRYREAAPYRSILAADRADHPDSIVYGIRLDPLTTPINAVWGDSRILRWGFLRASSAGVEIVRSDGLKMLRRPWDEIQFTALGLDVWLGDTVEEWWFPVMNDSGLWGGSILTRQRRNRVNLMLALRTRP